MKNLIAPEILAEFQTKPVPMEKIMVFLDTHPEVTASMLSKLCDVPVQQLYNYRTKAKRRKPRPASQKMDFMVVPSSGGAKYTASDKLALVKQFEKVDGSGRAEILRRYGIYQSDIDRWQKSMDQAALESLSERKTRSDKQSVELKTIEGLKKELLNREKKITKLETLVSIQKKLSVLLGESEST